MKRKLVIEASNNLNQSIKLFINLFVALMFFDILICLYNNDNLQLISSTSLLLGLIISGFLVNKNMYEESIIFLCTLFYGVAIFNSVVIGNYVTCYLILIVAPIITSLLLDNLVAKIVLISASLLLFILSNILTGFHPFENYYFFVGVVPSSLLMINFYNKLQNLTNDKNDLIDDLKVKNEEVLLFSTMMSHDLKAPLKSIEGFSRLLQSRFGNSESKEKQYSDFIVQGSVDLKNLINDLLEYSKFSINEISFQRFNFENLINQILSSFEYDIKKSNVEIKKCNLSSLYGHKDSIYLLFQNLISNSIKYQPKCQEHKPVIEISQITNDKENVIVIKDNGIGMKDADINTILEPFKRLHSSADYEGTGLGMSIVNKIVEKHEGKIDIESEVNVGSVIQILLPAKSLNDDKP